MATPKTKQQTCHVCGAENPAHARFCNNCGAALAANGDSTQQKSKTGQYSARYGENDLIESETNWRTGIYIFGLVLGLILVGCGVLALVGTGAISFGDNTPNTLPTSTAGAAAPDGLPESTNTPRPTRQLVTVTPAPPTSTATPTEGPCERQVSANDTLIGIISSCGHRDLDVIDEVLELNGLSDASSLPMGQVIQVPRPTPTTDPNLALTEAADGENNPDDTSSNSFSNVLLAEGADGGLPTFTPQPSPTLPAGIQWHTIQRDQTIIGIVNQYGAGVEILSQLNPEITFSQCEFNASMPYGGPSCSVFLIEGMRMRVPAPTPTPTLSPTPSGSETATPSPSPTFNAPSLVSPGNRVFFERGELVTLRWRGTGTLGENQAYRVIINDLTNGFQYEQNTRDTTLILPREWQGTDGERNEYQWQVQLINLNAPQTPLFNTETRTLTWEATGEQADEENS